MLSLALMVFATVAALAIRGALDRWRLRRKVKQIMRRHREWRAMSTRSTSTTRANGEPER